MGDPAGVGPEICLDLLADPDITGRCTPVVFGDCSVLEQCGKTLGKPLNVRQISRKELRRCREPAVLNFPEIPLDGFQPGTANAITGKATYHYILEAIEAALAGDVDAITTGPANKEAMHLAGVAEPGHTEILAKRTGSGRVCMLQTSDVISCSFVTIHVGYAEVPDLLSVQRVTDVIDLTREAMKRLRGHEPKLVVCGLNPHAGENGLFGNGEEQKIILPAVDLARGNGCQIDGPLPPDTCFLDWRREETDAFICMYHDQGHIPLKALAFDRAVNCTLGLPFVRTSVDHGTALDIAWKGKANPRSLKEAAKLAARLAN